jgi:hypothetical protein
LAEAVRKSGCPALILGEAKLVLSAKDLEDALATSGAEAFELLSHSAGYIGLELTLQGLKGAPVLSKLSALKLLDNFYDPKGLIQAIDGAIGTDKSREICSGFLTAHNQARYRSGVQAVCPKVELEGDHKASVARYW